MNIEKIKEKVKKKEYYFTLHSEKERQNDNLLISEVLDAIESGIIIEDYGDTGRGEACLVAGYTKQGKPIHIICGELRDNIAIITVYIPSPPKFKNIYERE